MVFPIDEKGVFNIFTDFEFVKPHKGALVFLDCQRILIQYEAKTGPISPGFIVPLRTEIGETYVLETKGFLHEGKKAFVFGEAQNLSNNQISSSLTSKMEITSTMESITPIPVEDESSSSRIATILGLIEKPRKAPKVIAQDQSEESKGSKGMQDLQNKTNSDRLIPRDYFFKPCEESCFKICFTAITNCTLVGILFFCNTINYCLSLTQFIVFKAQTPGCCKQPCNNHSNDEYFRDSLANGGIGNLGISCMENSPCCIQVRDCCEENICVKTGPQGPQGPTGDRGCPGTCGTRTFILNISQQGTEGKTLPTLTCSILGSLFLETGISLGTIKRSLLNHEVMTSNCVKLWQCDGSNFQWILPSTDYVFYDTDNFFIWIVQNTPTNNDIPSNLQNNLSDTSTNSTQTAILLKANLGDIVINSATGNIYIGNNQGQWIADGSNIIGPTGPTGPQGPIGPTGGVGIAGPIGPVGIPIGSAVFSSAVQPSDFVLIPNSQGSLINFVNISLDSTSIPVGTITISSLLNSSSQSELEIDMMISNIEFASSATSAVVGPGQHISGTLTIDLSTFLINSGFNSNFVGNPTIIAAIQENDVAINQGFPNNIYCSLTNGNQVKVVIVYYNLGPNPAELLNFQNVINLGLKISGIVATN